MKTEKEMLELRDRQLMHCMKTMREVGLWIEAEIATADISGTAIDRPGLRDEAKKLMAALATTPPPPITVFLQGPSEEQQREIIAKMTTEIQKNLQPLAGQKVLNRKKIREHCEVLAEAVWQVSHEEGAAPTTDEIADAIERGILQFNHGEIT